MCNLAIERRENMVRRTIDNFNLSQICESGQCFRMKPKNNNTYSIIARGRYLEAEQREKECVFLL